MKKLLLILLISISIAAQAGDRPKYIFYFIGDGMGHNALSLTEACLASEQGDDVGFSPLHFTQFPTVGFATTWCANRRMTDSAAGGNALATGKKTSVGTIGMNPERTEPVSSIAVAAKEQGMRTGVATSVSIDHATPASFFAHQVSSSPKSTANPPYMKLSTKPATRSPAATTKSPANGPS